MLLIKGMSESAYAFVLYCTIVLYCYYIMWGVQNVYGFAPYKHHYFWLIDWHSSRPPPGFARSWDVGLGCQLSRIAGPKGVDWNRWKGSTLDHGHMTTWCTISYYGKPQILMSPSSDWSCNAGFRLALFSSDSDLTQAVDSQWKTRIV